MYENYYSSTADPNYYSNNNNYYSSTEAPNYYSNYYSSIQPPKTTKK